MSQMSIEERIERIRPSWPEIRKLIIDEKKENYRNNDVQREIPKKDLPPEEFSPQYIISSKLPASIEYSLSSLTDVEELFKNSESLEACKQPGINVGMETDELLSLDETQSYLVEQNFKEAEEGLFNAFTNKNFTVSFGKLKEDPIRKIYEAMFGFDTETSVNFGSSEITRRDENEQKRTFIETVEPFLKILHDKKISFFGVTGSKPLYIGLY